MKIPSLKGARTARLVSALVISLVTAITCYHLLDPGPAQSGNGAKETPRPFQMNPSDPSVFIEPGQSEFFRPTFFPVPQGTKLNEKTVLTQLVCPPVARLAPQPTTHSIDNESGARIELASGSSIQVPVHAFTDATGKPVTKPVTLNVTEYRDYMDIFLAGIPMKYGDRDQLESAGMVRLEANAGGDPVFINRSAPLHVLLQSHSAGRDYNLYLLNERSGKWAVKGKDEVRYARKELSEKQPVPAYKSYEPARRIVSVVSFEGVPEDKVFLWWKSKARDFEFSFTRFDMSYPELRALSLTKWKYEGEDAREVYKQLFNVKPLKGQHASRRGIWDTCEVQAGEQGKIKLLLTGYDQTMELEVVPADKNNRNQEKIAKRMEQYARSLDKRIRTDQARYLKYQADSTAYIASTIRKTDYRSEILRSFTVDRFGIWNVDKIVSQETYAQYKVRFTDESGQEILVKAAYVADQDVNTVFTYYFDGQPMIRLNRESRNLLWFILPGDKLAVVYPDKLSILKYGSGVQPLPASIRDDAFASMESVREELNF